MESDKKAVRKLIRELKKEYTLDQKKIMSTSVWKQVEKDPFFQKAEVILIYWSMEDEVFTHDFIAKWAKEKTFLLPCVKGECLEIRYFDSAGQLVPGEGYSILEPTGHLFPDCRQIDLAIVPGIAFDIRNNRLGRGKGYYDKILQTISTYKIGVCFHFQFFDQIPAEKYDIPMNRVVCSVK